MADENRMPPHLPQRPREERVAQVFRSSTPGDETPPGPSMMHPQGMPETLRDQASSPPLPEPPPRIDTSSFDNAANEIVRRPRVNFDALYSGGTTGPLAPPPQSAVTIVPTIYPDQPSGVVIVQNYITINVHSGEGQQFLSKFDELIEELKRSNQIAGEARDQAIREMTAGTELLSAPKVDRNLIDLLLVKPLRWLIEKAGAAVVGKLASDVLDTLLRLMGN